MTPFPDFEPGHYAEDCRLSEEGASLTKPAGVLADFNQPSVFVQLHKAPEALVRGHAPALLNAQGALSFGLGQRVRVDFKDDRSSLAGLGPGLHVLARAQAYYHHPGNWQENPNFFNPYWRARLAATYQGRSAFPALNDWLNQLPGSLARNGQRVLTH
jgi:hypothetical protein